MFQSFPDHERTAYVTIQGGCIPAAKLSLPPTANAQQFRVA